VGQIMSRIKVKKKRRKKKVRTDLGVKELKK
jgi:hypothetical protein